MTIKEVEERVAKIAGMTGDPESAHVEEDNLYIAVLSFIAEGDGASLHVQLAREAIKADKIDFSRWYA